MQKVRIKKAEEKAKPVSYVSWDIEPVEDIDGLQRVLEQYEKESHKKPRKKGGSSDGNQLKRNSKASVQLSNETEIRAFFEELIGFLGKIPPLIQIRKKETNITIDNKNRPSYDPNDPPEPNGPHLTITNVINIDISIGGKK